MPPTQQELSLLLHPLVPESLAHNTKTLSTIRSLTALLLGISAGILGLQSLTGFAYYIISTSIISLLIHLFLVQGKPGVYFAGSGKASAGPKGSGKDGFGGDGAWRTVWFGAGVYGEALSGFVLGWAGVGGVIR